MLTRETAIFRMKPNVSFYCFFDNMDISFFISREKMRAELRNEFMGEEAAKHLLKSPKWKKRSFDEIKKRLAGFEDNELKKILVRAGAVSFKGKDNHELWELIESNEEGL